MKFTTLSWFVATLFMLSAPLVLADDRHGDRGDRGGRDIHVRDGDGWRLGERTRGGYAIYRRANRGWYRVPGAAIAVADGWVLGTKRESGGYAIYRWNGHGWDQAPGGAVEIGGSYNRPWVVNNRGQRFTWNGYDWHADYGYRHSRNDNRNAFGRDSFDRDNRGRFGYRGDNRRRYDHRDRRQDNHRYRRHSRW